MSFRDASNMRTHLLTHSKTKKFKCHLCDKSYTRLNMLKAHVLTHSGLNKFTCATCNRGFGTASNYKTHLKTHLQEQHGEFICTECGEVFSTNQNLRFHRTTHSINADNPRPFVCMICERTYQQMAGLKRHMREKHEYAWKESTQEFISV